MLTLTVTTGIIGLVMLFNKTFILMIINLQNGCKIKFYDNCQLK